MVVKIPASANNWNNFVKKHFSCDKYYSYYPGIGEYCQNFLTVNDLSRWQKLYIMGESKLSDVCLGQLYE